MLPKPLTEDICSLRSGVERLAFSAIWEMTPDADVAGVRCASMVPDWHLRRNARSSNALQRGRNAYQLTPGYCRQLQFRVPTLFA